MTAPASGIARLLGREWRWARAWLYQELGNERAG
jgi:hypothetical protein